MFTLLPLYYGEGLFHPAGSGRFLFIPSNQTVMEFYLMMKKMLSVAIMAAAVAAPVAFAEDNSA
ncbi:hypothetical protein ACI2I5_24960, partial [Serratia bockelmannii]